MINEGGHSWKFLYNYSYPGWERIFEFYECNICKKATLGKRVVVTNRNYVMGPYDQWDRIATCHEIMKMRLLQ